MRTSRSVGGAAGRALVVGLSLSAAACATRGDVQDLGADLSSELEEVRTTQDSLGAQLSAVSSQLDRMEAGQEDLILGRSSELQRGIEGLRDQLSRLTALLAQTRQRLERELTRRPAGGEAEPAAGAAGGEDAGPDAAEGDPAALYRAALEQFRRESYETSREALQEFVSSHPDHRLIADARYYFGRSREETGEVDGALEAYQRVVELHPNSNRAPSALYRRALIHLDRGETEAARRLLQQIIRGYPDSPEATPATRQLEEIGGS